MILPQTIRCLALVAAGSCSALQLQAEEGTVDRVSTPADALTSASEDGRFLLTASPNAPAAQHPPTSNENNVDTGKPVRDWQRATDDWWGLRPKLNDRGITLQANLTLDTSWDLAGGANPRSTAIRYLLNANLTLDTAHLVGWKDGTFFLNFQNQDGRNGEEMVRSVQGISNIDSDRLTQISELWYQQLLWDGKARIKVGKVDANAEFARVENGAEFLNSSFGFSPTIVGFPSYPNPATSLNIMATPTPWLYCGVGLYDGATMESSPTGSRGPAGLSRHGMFYIGEAGLKWGETLRGRVGAGSWHHTGDMPRFDGRTQSGTTGYYLTLDQQLWRQNPSAADDNKGLAMFAQYGWADAAVSPVEQHLGAGLTWTGLIPGRDSDVLGLAATYARLSKAPGAAFDAYDEVVVELFYKVQVLTWLSVKPDLQYIHNPGGLKDRDDALAATLRVQIDF